MTRRDPNAPIAGLSGAGLSGATLADFWSWAYSDLLDRGVRQALAQFVVGWTLDTLALPRQEWSGPNLAYRTWTLRVHYCGHVDAWDAAATPTAAFARTPPADWGRKPELFELDLAGAADCHVICHYAEQDARRAEPLDVAAWEFFVLSEHALRRELAPEGTVDLRRLRFSCDPVKRVELASRVNRVLGV